MPLRHDVFPNQSYAIEGVDDAVVVGETERDGARVESASEAQPAAVDGNRGTQVELDRVVEFVGVDAVDFGDVEIAVGREEMEDPVDELEAGEAEFGRENELEEALAKGQNSE